MSNYEQQRILNRLRPHFETIKQKYENDGRNKTFKLDSIDLGVYVKMIGYFTKDIEICERNNIDLNKGILLCGLPGVGKTSLIKHLNEIIPTFNESKVCRDIELEYHKIKDISILDKYGNTFLKTGNTPIPKSFFFDDLGEEKNVSNFRDEFNLMEIILEKRHRIQMNHPNHKTFATTNLSLAQIEERYGTRMKSRFSEMFNHIIFNKDSINKRKL